MTEQRAGIDPKRTATHGAELPTRDDNRNGGTAFAAAARLLQGIAGTDIAVAGHSWQDCLGADEDARLRWVPGRWNTGNLLNS